MELREIGEFGLIARIRNRLPTLPLDVFRGIGEDAAIASLSPGTDLASTVDLLVEEVHFDRALISAHLLGRKALAVNLSDIAAMGARPRFALISLALPARRSAGFTDDFYRGFLGMPEACLWERHFDPIPRVREGKTLAEKGLRDHGSGQ